MTAVPLVALITTRSTSLSNPGNMKEAPKIITQKKTKKTYQQSSKTEANLRLDTERAFIQAK